MADACICSLRESYGSRRPNGVKDFVASSLHQGQVLLDFLQITFNGTFAILMLHRSSRCRNKDRQATRSDHISPKPPTSTLTQLQACTASTLVSHVSVSYQCRALLESNLWTLSLDIGRLPVHRTARRVACYWSLSPSAFALGKLMSSSFAALLHVCLLRDSASRRWPPRQPTTAEALFSRLCPGIFIGWPRRIPGCCVYPGSTGVFRNAG